jgi:glycosyltransferase involved in cell wall biosynthesis
MRSIRKIALMAVGDSAWQGGIQYIVNIINALNTVSSEKRLEVHLFRHPHQKFIDLKQFDKIDLSIHNIDEVLKPWTLWNRLKWFLQRKFQKRIYPRLENYLLANHFDYVYPATLSDCNGRLNVGSWIADFQYHNYPDGHDSETNRQAEMTIRFIATKMRKVVFSSAHCEKEGLHLFPQSKGKTHVMPFSVFVNERYINSAILEEVRNYYDIHEPYLMVSNLFAMIKNHKTLFKAISILRKEGLRIKLVCTGNFVNAFQIEYANEVLQMITSMGIRDQLFILGLIPREHQVALYRMSLALVQPSLHEGWSTCVEEAKALGKNLLISDIPVHREQWPDHLSFFNPNDATQLASKIRFLYDTQQLNHFPEVKKEKEGLLGYERSVRAFGENFIRIASVD